ncbi:PilZ domain-containing protein [Halopseudomonas yangmingensis]|uniref:PilZ domain-containing protein n=2 Tax=Halopseudomonas yangmingensis TaxID=1720063 RepID=A0A1I4QKF5_9GAMM|nr:PilZ domain-containing protein [Halopseudomonas yangmingensis]
MTHLQPRDNPNNEERRTMTRNAVSSSLEVFDLDSGEHLGRVVDLHSEGMMLLSERPLDLNRNWTLQVNLPMKLNGHSEFFASAESLWNRTSITGSQHWTGLQFTRLPDEARQCIERMVGAPR